MTVNVNTPTRKDPGKKELLNLFDKYVHGDIDRRSFLAGSAG